MSCLITLCINRYHMSIFLNKPLTNVLIYQNFFFCFFFCCFYTDKHYIYNLNTGNSLIYVLFQRQTYMNWGILIKKWHFYNKWKSFSLIKWSSEKLNHQGTLHINIDFADPFMAPKRNWGTCAFNGGDVPVLLWT